MDETIKMDESKAEESAKKSEVIFFYPFDNFVELYYNIRFIVWAVT